MTDEGKALEKRRDRCMRISSDRAIVIKRLEARGLRLRALVGQGPELEGFDDRLYYDVDQQSGAVVLWKTAGNVATAARVHLRFEPHPWGSEVRIFRATWWHHLRERKPGVRLTLAAAALVLILAVVLDAAIFFGTLAVLAVLSIRGLFGLHNARHVRALETVAYEALAPDELGEEADDTYRLAARKR